jgi:hypothetical protein
VRRPTGPPPEGSVERRRLGILEKERDVADAQAAILKQGAGEITSLPCVTAECEGGTRPTSREGLAALRDCHHGRRCSHDSRRFGDGACNRGDERVCRLRVLRSTTERVRRCAGRSRHDDRATRAACDRHTAPSNGSPPPQTAASCPLPLASTFQTNASAPDGSVRTLPVMCRLPFAATATSCAEPLPVERSGWRKAQQECVGLTD